MKILKCDTKSSSHTFFIYLDQKHRSSNWSHDSVYLVINWIRTSLILISCILVIGSHRFWVIFIKKIIPLKWASFSFLLHGIGMYFLICSNNSQKKTNSIIENHPRIFSLKDIDSLMFFSLLLFLQCNFKLLSYS